MSRLQRRVPYAVLAIVLCLPLPSALCAADCAGTKTGFTPLNAPFFGSYHSMAGGLYPGGANMRPAGHEAAGLQLASQVTPRGPAGSADATNGKIVFLSVGMSNTTMEFSAFKAVADQDPDKNPRVVIVDGAQGGWSADRLVANGAQYWTTVDTRLAASGVTAAQVQVAWMKQADASPTLPFPDHARQLQSQLLTIAQTLRQRFPNLRLLYLSSRIYAGYATTKLNPEPYAYEGGFAVKWLIEQQINGDAQASFQNGSVPWLSWGPYLWADGTTPRDDGLVWNCSDFQAADGTHPADPARQKVATMLLNFLKTDTTTRSWFVRAPAQPPPKPQPTAVVNAASYAKEVAAGSAAALFGTELSTGTESAPGPPFPTVLAGTMVKVGGEPALLYYVSPSQINWVVPNAPATNELVVVRDGVESAPLAFSLALAAPGVFSLTGFPDGPAAALDDYNRVITPANPVPTGGEVQLFLTGLGVRNPLLMIPVVLPVVQVGGATALATSFGPSPGSPGLDQINFKVPADATPGSAVPLMVLLGSAQSNKVTLAVGK